MDDLQLIEARLLSLEKGSAEAEREPALAGRSSSSRASLDSPGAKNAPAGSNTPPPKSAPKGDPSPKSLDKSGISPQPQPKSSPKGDP